MSKLIKTDHSAIELTRQEAYEIIALLAQELAESSDKTIILPLGLDDDSEKRVT